LSFIQVLRRIQIPDQFCLKPESAVVQADTQFCFMSHLLASYLQTINMLLKNKNQAVRQAGKARGDATSAAYSSICEHWREPRNAAWRPQAQFFNSLLKQGLKMGIFEYE